MTIGKPVPTFEVEAYVPGERTPRPVSLKQFAGSWLVILFYPRDFTFVCPTELQACGELQDAFAAEEAAIIAASTDSYWSHKAWFESHPMLTRVRFPVIADTTQRLSSLHGVLSDDGSASGPHSSSTPTASCVTRRSVTRTSAATRKRRCACCRRYGPGRSAQPPGERASPRYSSVRGQIGSDPLGESRRVTDGTEPTEGSGRQPRPQRPPRRQGQPRARTRWASRTC